MKLIRYNNGYSDPFTSLDSWFEEAFKGLNRYSETAHSFSTDSKYLPIDISEDTENFYVNAELPGIKRENLRVELENNVLKITGERKLKGKNDENSLKFERSVTVGNTVDAAKVRAELTDGILTVTLPRREEQKPRTISVS